MQISFKPRLLAVQAVTFASASMSAFYYAGQAPEIATSVAGLIVNPAALGLGAMAFALDLTKPQMLQVAGSVGLELSKRFVAGAIFGVLFLASMIAVDGTLMRLRSDWAGERGNAITTHADAKAEVDRLTTAIEALGTTRPVQSIDAALETAVDVNVWRRSAKCTDVTRDDTRKACEPAMPLLDERGRAVRKAELEPQLVSAREVMRKVKPPKVADPQAASLAQALEITESTMGYLLIAIVGFALELVACAGLWLLIDKPKPQVIAALTDEQRALEWVRSQIDASGGKLAVLNQAIAGRYDVDPATVTRWRQRWIEAGHIEEDREGRTIILRRAR
jgi:hypothetical protein